MTEITTLISLGGVALVAGAIDAIAGGGGLLCLPALLLAGLNPVAALATNKLQGTFGTASATATFWRKGLINPQHLWLTVATTFVGAAVGVAAITYAPTQLLKFIMPPLLIVIALYFAFAPKFSNESKPPRLRSSAFTYFFAPVIGFYDGIFGPGTGAFFILSLTSLFGLGVIEATGRTKLFNFASNIAALLMFVIAGKPIWLIGLVMGGCQFIGAQIGSHLAIRNGAAIIRPLLVIVCLAMAAKLMLDPANPVRLWILGQ